jgi:hypothetical protein
VSPVKYELGFYIPEDAILHSDRREYLTSYVIFNFSSMPSAFLFKPVSSISTHTVPNIDEKK